MLRNATRVLTALAIAAAATLLGPAGTAQAAAYGCNGTQIDSWNNYHNGTRVATTYLYWDGTYNCVAAVKRGDYYGKRSRIAVQAWTDATGYVGEDDGHYLYYANYRFYGKNRCIAVETAMWNFSGSNIVQDHVPPSGWFHCG
ncbi:hypothetical protein RM572_26790 [Streptomyces sp. DSM 42041]|uniref:Secreted protein n=1 Tax=Streptomyces hazeniae TaxID=3075538 RepID=A0ABU2P0U9_9ACTN|nr:hypothetical protein [Streptomyces sp. DSM 42041]MDT0382372.1 hypothetical protein [Streptomyces sp. DSM 42041]